MQTFFDRYSELCKAQGETPNSVARKLGISSGSVTAWKNGAEPRMATVTAIAAFFGVPVNTLLPIGWLSDAQQAALAKRFDEALAQRGITEAFAVTQAKVNNNFFPRLRAGKLHTAPVSEILSVADYLGIRDDVEGIVGDDSRTITNADDFTYAMHNASQDLTEEDKRILIEMAERLRRIKKG